MRTAITIPIHTLLSDPHRFGDIIDVRAPSEFQHDHIPGALNYPVLSDAQRAEIGTLHKQDSAFAAKRRGAALVARNIADTIETALSDKPQHWAPIVYCWRGGQRSNSLATVLARIGWRAHVLDGGYKVYRAAVVQALNELPKRFEFRVLCGRTGTGKSALLQLLAAQGAQTIDLEALAAHRGSVLGHLPNELQPSQKMFDSLLFKRLSTMDPSRPIYVESESKKVGAIQVPDALMLQMRASKCIEIHAPLNARVQLLLKQYDHFTNNQVGQNNLVEQLSCLTALHGKERIEHWQTMVSSGQWEDFVADMLQAHYDPAYDKSISRNYVLRHQAQRIEATHLDDDALNDLTAKILSSPSL